MQVEIMIWFQGLFENFQKFFDIFFMLVTAFGEELVFFIVLPVFYWAINKELSHLVALAGFTTLTVNGLIKDIAQVPRPIGYDGIRFVEIENFLVDTVHLKEGSFSFPSGHSQIVSTLAFSFSCYYKKTKLWIASIILVLLVMMSRMYLGVHWPLDVLIGGLLGLIIAVGTYILFTKIKAERRMILFLVIGGLSVIALFIAVKPETFKSVGGCLGLVAGIFLEQKFVNFDPKEGKLWKKILRIVIGLALLMGLKSGLKPLFALISDHLIFDFIRYFLIVFVAIFLYPMLFKKIKL